MVMTAKSANWPTELNEENQLIVENKGDTDDMKFTVVLKGGSIGERNIRSASDLTGQKVDKKFKMYNDRASAKKSNKSLSPGEKSYYGLRYIVVSVKDGKFTGK